MYKNRELTNQMNSASGKLINLNINKENILKKNLPNNFVKLHMNRSIAIHDAEFFDIAPNCIGLSALDLIKIKDKNLRKAVRKLFREIIQLTNEQSGGIGFIDFDKDMSRFLGDETFPEIVLEFSELFNDLNTCVRKGSEKAYVTFNFGLDTTKKGRKISLALLKAFQEGNDKGNLFIFPNLVFKVKSGINKEKEDDNYDIFQSSLRVTSKCMIPTYLNCDSSLNKNIKSTELGIMGCRTRVGENIFNKAGSLNRGNIASITINLVQLAYKAKSFNEYYYKLLKIMLKCKSILLIRYKVLKSKTDLSYFEENNLYLPKTKNLDSFLGNGSLSIGFIGLWDAMEILLKQKIDNVDDIRKNLNNAFELIKYMRGIVDKFRIKYNLNFSLLASAGEGICGRFANYDRNHFKLAKKEYYTNSFHVPVNIKINYFEKLEIEGIFHKICNGGAISYVELKEIPDKNISGVEEIIKYAIRKDCGYIGVNFPLDQCKECGKLGKINDKCIYCGSDNILKLRRVSGYLGEIDKFSYGKSKELTDRFSQSL